MPGRKVTRDDLRQAAEKYKNWGKWGPDDEIGTLNYTQPEDIVAAAKLVKKGRVISLALNFDNNGPQASFNRPVGYILSGRSSSNDDYVILFGAHKLPLLCGASQASLAAENPPQLNAASVHIA